MKCILASIQHYNNNDALLVALIPTTIGGLLPAIGVAGITRLGRDNIVAKSGIHTNESIHREGCRTSSFCGIYS